MDNDDFFDIENSFEWDKDARILRQVCTSCGQAIERGKVEYGMCSICNLFVDPYDNGQRVGPALRTTSKGDKVVVLNSLIQGRRHYSEAPNWQEVPKALVSREVVDGQKLSYKHPFGNVHIDSSLPDGVMVMTQPTMKTIDGHDGYVIDKGQTFHVLPGWDGEGKHPMIVYFGHGVGVGERLVNVPMGNSAIIKHVNPKNFRWNTEVGIYYTPEEMSVQYLVNTLRMIWNNHFARKYGVKPVSGGKEWDLSGPGEAQMVVATHVLTWELRTNRTLNGQKAATIQTYQELQERFAELHVVQATSEPKIQIPKEFFMNKKIKTVGVQFSGNQQLYVFLTTIADLAKDDNVIVRNNNGDFRVGTVFNPDADSQAATAWVIQKVDTKEVDAILSDIKEAARLQQELDEKLNKLNRDKVYDELVSKDPDAKALFARLKELGL